MGHEMTHPLFLYGNIENIGVRTFDMHWDPYRHTRTVRHL